MRHPHSSVFGALVALPIALAAACGDATSELSGSATGTGGSQTISVNSGAGGDIGLATSGAGGSGGGLDENSACAKQEAEATLTMSPVDIVVAIDNSGSMTESIGGVQNNINENFAKILENSGIDYRVVLVAKHGKYTSGQSVCIEAPLSGIPKGGCANPPAKPVNGARFFHYSQEVSSHDALCQLLRTYSLADEHLLAPNGWKEWLRPEALKLFLVVTDDSASCTFGGKSYSDGGTSPTKAEQVAKDFDAALLALDPAQFGDAMTRRYRFHGIVAIADKDPMNPALPWPPADPLNVSKCGDNPNPGLGYQALARLTEGLRFPICSQNYYDAIFQELAKGVISGAAIECSFPIPDPPPGQMIDPETVVVEFTPSDASPAQSFTQVKSEADCGPGKFYLTGDAIQLCKDTCETVGKDKAGKIKVLFGCVGVSN